MKRTAAFLLGAIACSVSGGVVVGGIVYLAYALAVARPQAAVAGVGGGIGMMIGFFVYTIFAANATNLDNK